MSRVRGANTQPELKVRRVIHSMGFRFRIHRSDLPGKPDIVLPRLRKIVLVHGCFWHGHNCRYGKLPKSRLDFWRTKLEYNRAKDIRNLRALRRLGWGVLTVWQCETRRPERLLKRLSRFLLAGDLKS